MKKLFNGGCMGRREFTKLAATGVAASALPKGAAGLTAPGPEMNVALGAVPKGSNDKTAADAIRLAAEAVTDFSWLSKGDAVLIKPVCNSGNDYPATTAPAGIKAMVELLKDKGAGRVVLSDMSGVEHVRQTPDGVKGSSRELMKNNGMARAALAAGAEVHCPEEHGWNSFFEDGPASGSNWKAGIMMPDILKEVGHVVLMPRCGRHVLAGSTLGMKAAVGWWRFDSRLEYHRDAATLHEKTAESNTVSSLIQKQRLVLTTATKVLTTFGPDDGYVIEPETGLIIASESVVAHDMVSLAWLLENKKATPESDKNGITKDPYTSSTVVGIANRGVVMLLGGIGQAARAQTLTRHDIKTIWDDRVLNRAYQIFGGVPRVKLVDADGSIPKAIKQKLAEYTTPSRQ